MDWRRWKDRSSIAKEVAGGSSYNRGSGWMSRLAIPRPSCVLGGDNICNMLWGFGNQFCFELLRTCGSAGQVTNTGGMKSWAWVKVVELIQRKAEAESKGKSKSKAERSKDNEQSWKVTQKSKSEASPSKTYKQAKEIGQLTKMGGVECRAWNGSRFLNVYFRHKSKGLQRWTQEELQTEQRRKGDEKASLRSQSSSLAKEKIRK